MLFSPAGHVQAGRRHGAPNLGQPQCRSCPAQLGQRCLRMWENACLKLGLRVWCFWLPPCVVLPVSLPSIRSLPSFNLKQQRLFQVKSGGPQRCRLWGTMRRSSLFSVEVPAPKAEAKPQFLSKATRWVGMRAAPSLAAQVLEWGAPRSEVRERVELLSAPQAAWWGVVGGEVLMGSVGLQRLAIFPVHLPFSTQPPPPSLPFFTSSHFICLLWFVSCGQILGLFLRSEKGSAAKPVCWHQASVPVAGTQHAPAQFRGFERD